MPVPVVFVDISSQVIGEPVAGVWCSTCHLPSAIIGALALLVRPFGVESYEGDPVAKLATIWYCDGCGTYFELPDSPVLVDNREA